MTDYWKNRFIKSTKDVFDSDEEYVKEIFKIYEKTIEDLDSEIFKLLNSMEDVSMAEAKKLLNKYEIKSFKSALNEFRKASKGFISSNIEQELDIVSRRVRISRLQAMQMSMKSKVATLLNKEQKKLFAHLSNKFTSSYYKDLYELQRITGYKNINSLSKDFVNNILNTSWTSDGENFSDRIWKRKDKLLNTLDTELRQGLITGKRPDEITKAISDKLEVSKSNAKRLVLTESSAIHSQSRKAMYERMGVEKYEVVATLDLRTSDICRKLDGKVFDVKDYERVVTAPPFHVYCRSTTVPYYNDDIQAEIENTRMARDPETGKSLRVENLTYKEWYDKYVEKLPNNNQNSDTPNGPIEPKTKYTKAETNEAIEEYVSGDGMWINNKLRGIGEIADYPLREDDKIYLEKLDQATQSQIVKEKTLYRSVDISSIIGDISDSEYDDLKSAYIYNNKSKPAQEVINKYLKNIEGKEIVDKGFISTTKSKDIALDFQDFTGSSKPCVIEFNVPKGIKGIDLKDFDIADMEQKEVLLARNQKFVIREVRQEQGQFYFKADLVAENGYNINENIELPKLKKIFGEDDYKEFKSIISENKNEDIQKLYRNYGDKVNRAYIADNCKYSYKRNELFVRINSEEEIEDGIHKFSTLAHEYGHFFDHNVSSNLTHTDLEKIRKVIPKSLAPAEDILSSSDEFMKAIREDKKHLKSIGIKQLTEELIKDGASRGVQDAIDGMFEGSKNKIMWGHGEKYYNRKFNKIKKYADLYGEDYENTLIEAYKELGYKIKNKKDLKSLIRDYETASEAWANIASAVTCGGDELVYVKKYLPKSLEALLKIIKEVN